MNTPTINRQRVAVGQAVPSYQVGTSLVKSGYVTNWPCKKNHPFHRVRLRTDKQGPRLACLECELERKHEKLCQR